MGFARSIAAKAVVASSHCFTILHSVFSKVAKAPNSPRRWVAKLRESFEPNFLGMSRKCIRSNGPRVGVQGLQNLPKKAKKFLERAERQGIEPPARLFEHAVYGRMDRHLSREIELKAWQSPLPPAALLHNWCAPRGICHARKIFPPN